MPNKFVTIYFNCKKQIYRLLITCLKAAEKDRFLNISPAYVYNPVVIDRLLGFF